MSFQVQDTVQQKTGGPGMVIVTIDGAKIQCAWKEGRKIRREWFDSASLRKFRVRGAIRFVVR